MGPWRPTSPFRPAVPHLRASLGVQSERFLRVEACFPRRFVLDLLIHAKLRTQPSAQGGRLQTRHHGGFHASRTILDGVGGRGCGGDGRLFFVQSRRVGDGGADARRVVGAAASASDRCSAAGRVSPGR
ncbi:hypothetical protein AKJ09_09215 [Labilithrix luteola]|uniref:Uncharacterized protein n=1 Tax=Labilithrix luteola TaxID=1391654 RepID=A0A0K1QA54_9BACT|nr:hypothetical protein AKJ09_09215 [Labilithrix luteola]